MDYAVSENILAGNVMTRRASYMFGSLLPKDPKGGIGAGLANAISTGEVTLVKPTEIITETGQELVIDGVHFVFMNTPFAEAPAEMMFYLPQMKAFFAAAMTFAASLEDVAIGFSHITCLPAFNALMALSA